MKRALLVLTALAAAPLFAADFEIPQVPTPERGFFNWKKLEGTYKFVECVSRPGPIWSDDPESTHIRLDAHSDYAINPPNESLEAAHMNDGSNTVVPGLSVDFINQGPQDRRENETGRVYSKLESWTTRDGVFGKQAWEQPHNSGWLTFQIAVDPKGKIRYEMRRQFRPDPEYFESCELIRWEPREPARPGQPI
jgi:hypothetical protein